MRLMFLSIFLVATTFATPVIANNNEATNIINEVIQDVPPPLPLHENEATTDTQPRKDVMDADKPLSSPYKTEVTIILKDHTFSPQSITVPKGQKIELTINNQDAEPEEIESPNLNIEHLIAGNGEITITLEPLNEGTYDLFGDFNKKTARGQIVAE